MTFALDQVPSPCFVVDECAVENNLRLLATVQEQAGCRILLALKAFSLFSFGPLIRRYLAGTNAASLDEALLGREEYGGEVHITAPAYRPVDFPAILAVADHIVFNSFDQWQRYRPQVAAGTRHIECGIRINPRHSEVKVAAYDPCRPDSRLGVQPDQFRLDLMAGLTGLHFHTLCELGSDALERTLAAVERQFGEALQRVQWVNFGGGHHITRPDYDVERLIRVIREFRVRHPVTVYLEPGEAIGLNTGILVATVLDIVQGGGRSIAILDTSASTHMPDVLEMP